MSSRPVWAGRVAQVVERLPSKQEALSLSPNITEKKEKGKTKNFKKGPETWAVSHSKSTLGGKKVSLCSSERKHRIKYNNKGLLLFLFTEQEGK
jgi:hypothetical protein